MPTYREYKAKRPNRIMYETVEFYHPAFGYVRLVANQVFPKNLGGVQYDPCRFELTESQRSNTPVIDSTLKFSQLTQDFKQKLKAWRGLSRATPITCTIRRFDAANISTAANTWTLYVSDCSMDGTDVNVSLSMSNPLNRNIGRPYDPAEWPGLING